MKSLKIESGKTEIMIEGRGVAEHSEAALIVEKWNRVIIEKINAKSEIRGVEYWLYNYNGDLIGNTQEYWGESERILSEQANLIMLFMHTGFYNGHSVVLIDNNGVERRRFETEYLSYQAGFTDDGRYIWVVSWARQDEKVDFFGREASEDNAKLTIYDIEGRVVDQKVFNSANTYHFPSEDPVYTIIIPTPMPNG